MTKPHISCENLVKRLIYSNFITITCTSACPPLSKIIFVFVKKEFFNRKFVSNFYFCSYSNNTSKKTLFKHFFKKPEHQKNLNLKNQISFCFTFLVLSPLQWNIKKSHIEILHIKEYYYFCWVKQNQRIFILNFGFGIFGDFSERWSSVQSIAGF